MAAHISYEWAPDPQHYANRMFAVSEALRDTTAPLLFAAKQTQEEIEMSFLSQTSPQGRQWADWSDKYRPIAEAYPNEGILRQTTNLFDAATDESAFVIRGDTLFYDTKGWPWSRGKDSRQYGWIHTMGSNVHEKREFVGVGRGGQQIIFTAFEQWFDNSLALFVTKTGKLGIRGRSSLGTFVPMPVAPFRAGSRR